MDAFSRARDLIRGEGLRQFLSKHGLRDDEAARARYVAEASPLNQPGGVAWAYDMLAACVAPAVPLISICEWTNGASDPHGGVNHTLSWEALAARVEAEGARVCSKERSRYINPGLSTDGYRRTGSTVNATLLALDADCVGDWWRLIGAARNNCLAFIAYRSSGHIDGVKKKWRFCMPLARPIDLTNDTGRDWWRAAYRDAAVMLGMLAGLTGNGFDLSLSSVSQAIYYGHRRDEAAPARKVIWLPGRSFDLERFAASVGIEQSAAADFDVEPMKPEDVTPQERVARIRYWTKTWRRKHDELRMAVAGGRTKTMCSLAKFHGSTTHWGFISDEDAKLEILATSKACALLTDYPEEDLVRQIGNLFAIGANKPVPDLTTRPVWATPRAVKVK